VPEIQSQCRDIHGQFCCTLKENLSDARFNHAGFAERRDAIVNRLPDLPPIIIFRLRNVTAIDSTGLQALENFADRVHESGRQLILCGAREQPAMRMHEAEFHEHVGPENICGTVA
jgi:MFS superfamily sulfate permease-like transporter